MAVASRESYLEAGLEILNDEGVGGLKLAAVCDRLGLTSGSFYHHFPNWTKYKRDLLTYWRNDRTLRIIETIREEPGPRQLLEAGFQAAMNTLPHGAEAAIRAWSSVDPDVLRIQAEVDHQRFATAYNAGLELCGDPRQAEAFASACIYVLIGYEQATLAREPEILVWILKKFLGSLESGGFEDVPPKSAAG